MPVTVNFECGGCDAKADGTKPLRWTFRSFSGRDYGLGSVVEDITVMDVVPDGWMAVEPYTYCTYCPKCWEEITSSSPTVAEEPTDD